MKKEDLYKGISGIRPEFLDEADSYKLRKLIHWKRLGMTAACTCLCLCSSVPVLAAANNDFAYELLYAVSPSMAQKMKPVNVSCEDNGIKMEVIAANIEGANAAILIAMQDITGNRLDETADLFDSYSIHTPYNQSGGCFLVEYDAETKTAFFMVTIEQMNQVLIPGDKITFSVSEILSEKKHSDTELTEIDLGNAPLINNFIVNPDLRGLSGMNLDSLDKNSLQLMKPNEEAGIVLKEGAVLTGYGIIDGRLHVQIRYSNILKTDNHGYVYLKNQSGEVVHCQYSAAFWHADRADSYEEYIFNISSDELKDYEIWGEFWTCSGDSIEGSWQVTFPLTKQN